MSLAADQGIRAILPLDRHSRHFVGAETPDPPIAQLKRRFGEQLQLLRFDRVNGILVRAPDKRPVIAVGAECQTHEQSRRIIGVRG